MSRYAKIALDAAPHAAAGEHPGTAWDDAAAAEYPDRPKARTKSCPRSAFLGLAEDGLIVGVPPGAYLRPGANKNKGYAVAAIDVLRREPALADQPNDLWSQVMAMAGKSTTPNDQMHVVTALWRAGLITGP